MSGTERGTIIKQATGNKGRNGFRRSRRRTRGMRQGTGEGGEVSGTTSVGKKVRGRTLFVTKGSHVRIQEGAEETKGKEE